VHLRAWIVPAVMVAIAASVPVRADRQKADFNLEHRGVGLSVWQEEIDGVRYRLAGPTSSVFLPAGAQMVVLPLRAAANVATTGVTLELRLDGRPANVLTVPSDRWHFLRLALPRNRHAPRFRRLDLYIANTPSGDGSVLMVGKVEAK
jgi:hypothetical protein